MYWKKGLGVDDRIDRWLGIADRTVSVEARELCSQAAGAIQGFAQGARVLARLAQLTVSKERLRQIAEREGQSVQTAQGLSLVDPGWTAADCPLETGGPTRLIVGVDGVMVPMVTQAEKAVRRKNRRRKRTGQPRRKRMFKGHSDRYREFKIGAFYDQTKDHQYVFGTAGNHQHFGRLLRREACRLNFGRADQTQSLTDDATWIYRQLQIQLPVLDILTLAKDEGAVGLLRQIDQTRRGLRGPNKRQSLTDLERYIASRAGMVDYPRFIQQGFDIGSGPTEAFCKTLTRRLKGGGMKWDWPKAQAMMALTALDQSRLWETYWNHQRGLAA